MPTPRTTYLSDYRPPDYAVESVDLSVDLHDRDTRVKATLRIQRNQALADETAPLILDGRDLHLESVTLNERPLGAGAYSLSDEGLIIPQVPDRFTLETVVTIQPQANKSLEGLYRSGPMFCTQCEAEGFRKITYFPDRPDVMSIFTCTISADRQRFPLLLANGNQVDAGMLPGGRHWATWSDPFKKPAYLFALVAGDLFCLEDQFRTKSGRTVILRIFVEHENRDKCDHAMSALQKAMAWDEARFGLEYDLDIYMIVAVNDFNMGAMENKGLNIFNSKYVLARPETATDTDFWNIDRVIAHEYFHNWTGNRVTLNNWFQLSLKEGLTVFRDQEFSMDLTSRPVKRISDVRTLRSFQFPEDGGPMAHPVRPESYIKMDNFYTVTIYEKGAEVIRMLQTLLGVNGFRKGMDLYFQRHDGQAVTLEQFISAMSDANGAELSQFMLWYSQAGTPKITAKRRYDPETRVYELTLSQSCPPTPDMARKEPMLIPVALGLMDASGRDIPLRLDGETEPGGTIRVLELKEASRTFRFTDIPEPPVPSILRNFSAPVKLDAGYTDKELVFLFAHDSDPFNRWDAGQSLFSRVLKRLVADHLNGRPLRITDDVIQAFRQVLLNRNLDKSFTAMALTLPSESDISILISESAAIDPEAIHHAHRFVTRQIAASLESDFMALFTENQQTGPYALDPVSVGQRRLRHLALSYLGFLDQRDIPAFVLDQYEKAANMTDTVAALTVLSHLECPERETALDRFYRAWSADTLVLDKWFSIQAGAQRPDTLDRVVALTAHPAFSIQNPNKVRALIGAFCGTNPAGFHEPTGRAYRFIADRILELDAFNPMISARMAGVFNHFRKYEPMRQALMRQELERIAASGTLSEHLYEIVSRALGDATRPRP